MIMLSTAELIERMTTAMQTMSGEELADLFNREFGSDMQYLGDDLFEAPASSGDQEDTE
jgi:hypothetical protein